MNSIVPIDVIGSKKWEKYLTGRLEEFCFQACNHTGITVKIVSAFLVAPAHFEPVSMLDGEITDRIFKRTGIKDSGWKLRTDSFDIGVEFVRNLAIHNCMSFLFCWSELAEPKDPFLAKIPHLVFNNTVFLTSNIIEATLDQSTTTLRKCRRKRLFGIVGSQPNNPCSVEKGNIFITDAYDGDTIVACEIE